MKLVVLVNTLQSINSVVYSNHCHFWSYMGKNHAADTIIFLTPHRMAIDSARNWAAKVAMEQEADYLMFLDDDVLIEPDVFDSLIKEDKDIIMALTYLRGYPFRPMFFKKHPYIEIGLEFYDNYKDHTIDGLIECEAIGFSCALIKVSLLKQMIPPYFVTGTGNTEDIYFCVEAKKQIPNVSIFTSTKTATGHLCSPEAVMPSTVEALREYYKIVNPSPIENKECGDRSFSYIKACLANIK